MGNVYYIWIKLVQQYFHNTKEVKQIKKYYISKKKKKIQEGVFYLNLFSYKTIKEIVKWGEPCKCVIFLISRIRWH